MKLLKRLMSLYGSPSGRLSAMDVNDLRQYDFPMVPGGGKMLFPVEGLSTSAGLTPAFN